MGAKKTVEYLSADSILACDDLPEKDVTVPLWGGKVRIKAFSRDTVFQIYNASKMGGEVDEDRFSMLCLIHGIIEPKFTVEQLEKLKTKSIVALSLLVNEITEISGMKDVVQKAAEKDFFSTTKPSSSSN